MISVRLLLPAHPDYQTRLITHHLARAGANIYHPQIIRLSGNSLLPAIRAGLQLRRLAPSFSDHPTITHAWGTPALICALFSGSSPILFSPIPAFGATPPPRLVRWLRAVEPYRAVTIVCPTDSARRGLVTAGIPYDRCHLIRPGVDFARVQTRRDPQLRQSLGLSHEDRAILIPGEMTRDSHHETAILACALLHLLDQRNRLLLWDAGPRRDTVLRFAHNMGRPRLLVSPRASLARSHDFHQLLPAADIVMSAADDGQTLPLCMALAAGLPVIAAAGSVIAEVLENRHNALLVTRRGAPELARRVLDLLDSPALQATISRQARDDAYELFPLTKMLDAYRTLYQQAAAGPIPHESHPIPLPRGA
jgi:glycosyltransferase involved in cell wall biosynthesis